MGLISVLKVVRRPPYDATMSEDLGSGVKPLSEGGSIRSKGNSKCKGTEPGAWSCVQGPP